MFEFGNKEFRNLEEQVLKNQEDIAELQSGIKISYWVSSLNDLNPLVKEENYGKYVVVGASSASSSKLLYVITRIATGELMAVLLGNWPKKGDKGDKGDKGNTGDQGPQGERGIQGIQGVQGPIGSSGNGWDSLNEIDSAAYEPTVIGREVETSANLNLANGDSKVINLKYDFPIGSSDYIDIVENDSYNALLVKLRRSKLDTAVTENSANLITSGAVFNSLSTKLDATKDAISSAGGLTTPTTAPNEKEIVGLNNDGSQIRIKIGNNLSLAGAASPYTLNAIGGGGSGGVEDIYWATYQATSFTQIKSEYDAGKLILCRVTDSGSIYYCYLVGGDTAYFMCYDNYYNTFQKIQVTGNTWTYATNTTTYYHTLEMTGTYLGDSTEHNFKVIFESTSNQNIQPLPAPGRISIFGTSPYSIIKGYEVNNKSYIAINNLTFATNNIILTGTTVQDESTTPELKKIIITLVTTDTVTNSIPDLGAF